MDSDEGGREEEDGNSDVWLLLIGRDQGPEELDNDCSMLEKETSLSSM